MNAEKEMPLVFGDKNEGEYGLYCNGVTIWRGEWEGKHRGSLEMVLASKKKRLIYDPPFNFASAPIFKFRWGRHHISPPNRPLSSEIGNSFDA